LRWPTTRTLVSVDPCSPGTWRDVERGKRLATQIETGMMFINNIDWSDAELPFGGIKDSGYGRELGDMGIQEFVNKKLVRVHDVAAPVI